MTEVPGPAIEKDPEQAAPPAATHPEAEEHAPAPGHAESSAPASAPSAPEHPESPDTEPEDFYGWLMRSHARLEEGLLDEAWEAAQKALELGTEEPELYVPLCQRFPPLRRRQLADAAMVRVAERQGSGHHSFQWLWVELALSYWYHGEHDQAVAEFETILQQKDLDPQLQGVLENSLGMCLEAVDRYQEAEQRYLAAGNQEAAVRARARSGDLAGALDLLDQGFGPSEEGIRKALEATYLGLLGRPIPDLDERLEALLAYEDDWIYKEFMLGILMVLGERAEEGMAQLERFLEICRANRNEWGVTLRREIRIAEEILGSLGEGDEAPGEGPEGPVAEDAAAPHGPDASK